MHLKFLEFLFSMRLSNDEYFKDFKIFDLTWIWLIWLEWPVYKRGNTEFFLNGGSSRECDHDCEQLGDLYRVYISYISESMHCLHWGKSVNVKWIKNCFFLFFFKSIHWLEKTACIRAGYILSTSLGDDIQVCG